jgi:tripartite ATP-independent transporter DctP family solute receptor
MYTAAPSSIGPLVPAATIINVPFAFQDAAAGWGALDGDLGTYVADAFTPVGLTAFHTMWASGFREITSSAHPIETPADLKGFKIRVPNSPLLLTLFRSLGASPATLDISEAYTALQTHLVDGQENPLAIIATRNFNEVQKYCALTNHVWDVFIQTINTDVWKSIPPDLQQIVRTNFAEAARRQRQDVETLNASLQTELEGKGMKFNTPDTQLFRAALQHAGVYGQWKASYGTTAWGILEKYTGKLA